MHILMRFSLLHADTLACQAVYQREGLRPEMLSQLGGDNTDHALQQRGRTAEFLAALSGKPSRAMVENCYRHLCVLEEKAAMAVSFQQDEVVNMLRTVYEVIHAMPEYYEALWRARGLPINMWEQLLSMAEPDVG